MRRAPLAMLLALACYTGPSAANFAPARGPRGVAADLRLRSGPRVKGELLVVEDSVLLVMRDERIVSIPMRAVRRGRFHQVDAVIQNGRLIYLAPEELRLLSRFPGGIQPEARARLLAAHGQSEPDVVQ